MGRVMAIAAAAMLSVFVMGESTARAERGVKVGSAQSVDTSSLSLRLATTRPVRDFETAALSNGRTVYLAPGDAVHAADVVASRSVSRRGGNAAQLTLRADGAARLAGSMKKYDLNQAAVFQGGTLMGLGGLEVNQSEGRVEVSGLGTSVTALLTALSPADANPVETTLSLVPSQTVVRPGELVQVDVYATGVSNLRGYQLMLKSQGGQGRLDVEDLAVENSRSNYIFNGHERVVDMVDVLGQRVGAVLFDGGVNVLSPVYLASFSVRASEDASGSFNVGLVTSDLQSLLLNPEAEQLKFAVVGTTIAVDAQ